MKPVIFSILVVSMLCALGMAKADKWAPVPHDDKDMVAAAKFAVTAQSTASGEKLEFIGVQQAGSKSADGKVFVYKIQMLVHGHKGGDPMVGTALVSVKGDGSYKLKQWKWNPKID